MTASKWPYFTVEELTCNCGCGRSDMDNEFMEKLVKFREYMDVPFPVTSAYRCPEYDKIINGADVHTQGKAADIAVYYKNADKMITKAPSFGFTGRGLNQKGFLPGRFIHIDDLPIGGKKTRPATWTY